VLRVRGNVGHKAKEVCGTGERKGRDGEGWAGVRFGIG
jgi:hypothetical protein